MRRINVWVTPAHYGRERSERKAAREKSRKQTLQKDFCANRQTDRQTNFDFYLYRYIMSKDIYPPKKMASSSNATTPNSLPKKKARIFSNGSRARQRAVVFNTANFFNGDSANDEFDFSEPIAPVFNQAQDTPKVRKAHQCHESGESNQMDTDIEYFIESLDKEKNRNDIRCLSLLGLAKKVLSIEYRMHLRAHEDMPRIMTKLTDAPDDPSLALSCATLMFIHNQDKMSSDIDPVALKLMLNLINGGKNVHSTEGVEKRHKDTVLDLCTQMRDSGHAKNLNLQEITAAALATETLLSLNSKRAGDWFKEELRRLKGIDFILDTISNTAQTEDLETDDDQLNKLDRCMHLLENITFQNRSNQEYIINYNNGVLIDACLDLLTLCKREITVAVDDTKLKLFTTALSTTVRVLNNITSENETSSVIGSRTELTDLILYFINELQTFIKPEQRSDITMICVCLLINMVEFSKPLRAYLMNDSRIHDLIDTFYRRVNEAQQTEQQADLLLDSHKKEKMTEAMQDSLINQVIAKSGKHMEHSVIAACLAILFGCIIQDSPEYREQLISYLNQNSVAPLVDVLQKLHDFAHLADIMTSTGVNRVKRILKVLK